MLLLHKNPIELVEVRAIGKRSRKRDARNADNSQTFLAK
jgi:hypothetical protein